MFFSLLDTLYVGELMGMFIPISNLFVWMFTQCNQYTNHSSLFMSVLSSVYKSLISPDDRSFFPGYFVLQGLWFSVITKCLTKSLFSVC